MREKFPKETQHWEEHVTATAVLQKAQSKTAHPCTKICCKLCNKLEFQPTWHHKYHFFFAQCMTHLVIMYTLHRLFIDMKCPCTISGMLSHCSCAVYSHTVWESQLVGCERCTTHSSDSMQKNIQCTLQLHTRCFSNNFRQFLNTLECV